MRVVSREMIIDTMRQYVETKGEFPVSRLINKKSFGFTMHDINKHFGTLSNLAKEMGYIIKSGKRTNVLTVDEVLDRCEQIMEIFNIDRFPTITEIGCSGLMRTKYRKEKCHLMLTHTQNSRYKRRCQPCPT